MQLSLLLQVDDHTVALHLWPPAPIAGVPEPPPLPTSHTMLISNPRQLASGATGSVWNFLLPRSFSYLCFNPPLEDGATYSVKTQVHVCSKDLTKLPPAVLAEALQAAMVRNDILDSSNMPSFSPFSAASAPAPANTAVPVAAAAAAAAASEQSQQQWQPLAGGDNGDTGPAAGSADVPAVQALYRYLGGPSASPAAFAPQQPYHQHHLSSLGEQLVTSSGHLLQPQAGLYAQQRPWTSLQQNEEVYPQEEAHVSPLQSSSCQAELPVLVAEFPASLKIRGVRSNRKVELLRFEPNLDPFNGWTVHVVEAVSCNVFNNAPMYLSWTNAPMYLSWTNQLVRPVVLCHGVTPHTNV